MSSGILKKILASLILSLGTFFAGDAWAEPLDFIFEHYSADDGLPHNSICDIHQDRRGYLWLCTWYGLSRFDGNSFVNYTMLPGDYSNLSHNRILSVSEDASGYLWLMTYDYHLYRFDVDTGDFVAIPSGLEGFPWGSPKAVNVHCSPGGDVWVSFSGYGLMKISPDLSAVSFSSGHNVGKAVSHIYEDSAGSVYAVSETGIALIKEDESCLLSRISDVAAFAEYGHKLHFLSSDCLLTVDMETREQVRTDLASLGAGRATAMILDRNRLSVGFSSNAVATIDPADLSVVMHRHDMGRVRYLFSDPGGLLWIATDRTGIWSYNGEKDTFRHYEHERNVMSYYSDTLATVRNHDGLLWIKMNNWGFGYYDRDSDEIVPLDNVKGNGDCRFMNGVPCYYIDSSGVLWMSTVGRGLERVTVVSPKCRTLVPPTRSNDSMSSSEIRAMLRDRNGNLWVAAKSRELYMYSPDMSSCRHFPDAGSGDIGVIYSIFEDSCGNIWLGTKGDGLYRMTPDGSDFRWKHFTADSSPGSISSDNIYSVAQDMDGRIWVGTYGGALSMLPDPDSDEFITVGSNFPDYPDETGERVRYLHCMPDGKMLVAAVGGLIWFVPADTPELTQFHTVRKIPGDIRSLGNNDVIYIFTDRGDNTWLCTFGGGLNRLYFEDGIPRFEVISTADGLSSNIVHSAIDDSSGTIWIATERGLSKYDPVSGTVINYTKYDGVGSVAYSEAACAPAGEGMLAFGTLDNVLVFDPDDFGHVQKESRLTLSGLSIDGRRTAFADRIVIPHDYSFFRIDFASLNFSTRNKLNFSYMLEGYDKNWISGTGSSSATYSRIPPGRYVFKVSASYPEDSFTAETVTVPVRVRPSFWNSGFAVVLYILAGIILTVSLIRLTVTQMKLRNDVRLEQDLSNVKTRFFTNISHELRTPLTLILGGIDDISKKMPSGEVSDYSVRMVQKNAKRMMTLVNQLLDIRTIVGGKMRLTVSQFDIVRLVQGVYDDFRDMSSERQMEMRIVRSVDSLMVWGDQMRIEALVYNLLSNAFKYTSDGGKIEVGILYREGEDDYRIMVKDNGIGVPEQKRDMIFEPFAKGPAKAFRGMPSSGIGLSFCKEIADMHGGDIWVEGHNDGGSKFFVRLPVGKERFNSDSVQFADAPAGIQRNESYGLGKYKSAPSHPEGALKVLVVEDNAEMKVYIWNSLVSRYEVRDASNGKEALQVISEGWIPDVIVTDLMMPQMNGIELINHVRGDFATSHIPIVMITAKHEDDTHLKAMKYGADGYIAKPFAMELLIARIDNLLERRRTLVSMLSEQHGGRPSGKKGGKIEIAPEEIVITDRDGELIKKIMRWLEDNVADADVTVDQLAMYVGMGRTSMYNKIKGLTGKSPVELIQEFRMEKATYYLKCGQYSVSETSYKVGFSDPGYFSRSFKKHYGISPADYIKQNKSGG